MKTAEQFNQGLWLFYGTQSFYVILLHVIQHILPLCVTPLTNKKLSYRWQTARRI